MPNSSFSSIVDLFHHRIFSTPTTVAMIGRRHSNWYEMSWAEVGRSARRIACGLHALNLSPESRCAILSENRPEWVTADLGILCAGGATTTIYPSSTAAECAYILADSGAEICFVENAEQAEKLLEHREELPNLRTVVLFEGRASNDGWIITLQQLEVLGSEWDDAHEGAYMAAAEAVGPEQIATVIYTSGTTGPPKGVMLTHDNWIFESEGIDRLALMLPTDKQYLLLPLAHSFAKVLQLAFIRLGTPTVVDGDLMNLLTFMQETSPTIVGAVPRLFEKAYNKAIHQARKGGQASWAMFRWAIKIGRRCSELRQQGIEPKGVLAAEWKVADRLVLSEIRKTFGGKIKYFISGGAPLSVEIATFFHAAGILILEGYGLTESSAASFVNTPDNYRFGTVGKPILGVEHRIAPDGEILLRGRGVMKGYLNRPEATAEALDDDGWLHTGDIGVLEDGFLRITDRKKDIIVNAGGKNISPQNVERLLLDKSEWLSNVVVHGDRRPYLVALVTLDPAAISRWGRQHNRTFPNYTSMAEATVVKELIWRDIELVNCSLPPHETIKKFAILPRDLTIESGELTPTLKVKRRVVETSHESLLNELYRGTLQSM